MGWLGVAGGTEACEGRRIFGGITTRAVEASDYATEPPQQRKIRHTMTAIKCEVRLFLAAVSRTAGTGKSYELFRNPMILGSNRHSIGCDTG